MRLNKLWQGFGDWLHRYMILEVLIPLSTLLMSGFLVCVTPSLLLGLWPNFFCVFLYIWGLYCPERIPVTLVGLFGILHDVYTGVPLGFHAFLYAILYLLVVTQRQIIIDRPFMVIWVGFAAFILFLSGVGLFLARLFENFSANSFDLQFHMIVTIGILPLIYQALQPMLRGLHSS